MLSIIKNLPKDVEEKDFRNFDADADKKFLIFDEVNYEIVGGYENREEAEAWMAGAAFVGFWTQCYIEQVFVDTDDVVNFLKLSVPEEKDA